MKVSTFGVVAREDPDESGTFKIQAGAGCIWLSIGWVLAALLGAIGLILKVFS